MNKIIYTILLLLCITVQGAHAETRQVRDKEYMLVLSSITFDEVWSRNLFDILKKEFDHKLHVYGEELMVPMMTSSGEVSALRDSLVNKYQYPPKLVVFIGDPGWIAMRPLFDKEWKDVPTIIGYSREKTPSDIKSLISEDKGMSSLSDKQESVKGYNVTTIEQPFFIKQTVDLMKQLLPDMDKIVFIHDQRYISLSVKSELQEVVEKNFPELKIEYLSSPEISTEKLLDTISQYDTKAGIIYYSWFMPTLDRQQTYLNDHIQKVLFGFANTPIFTLADQNPSSGNFAGGYYISIDDIAKQVSRLADDMLAGKSNERSIVFDISDATKYLNYHHLQHHNVDPELYPHDAVYFQAPPSPFAKYKVRIISLLALFIVILTTCVFVAVLYIQKSRQRERELKLSAQYRKMIKNMPMPFLRKELIRNGSGEITDCRLLDMNPAFERLINCPRAQIAGKKLSETVALCPALVKITDKDDESGYDLCLSDEKGNKVYYDQLEFSDRNSNIIETFFINKTDSYREKKQTEEYYHFLQSILDNLPIATKVNDINDDLRCIYWNKKAADMFKDSTLDIVDTSFGDPEDTDPDSIDFMDIEAGEHWEGIRKYTQKDGKVHSFLVTRHKLDHMEDKKWLLSSAMDITEMQENRQMLEYLNNNFKLVLQSTRLIIVSWDITKHILYGDAQYAENSFFNQGDKFSIPEEVYFKNVYPDDLDYVAKLFKQLIDGEKDIIDHEYRLMDLATGHYRWINGYATVGERDENGNTVTIVGAIRDIDAHKLMEMELKRAKEKADESNRLKSAFLANMSHEIRTPLNAIVGFSNILALTEDENEKREYVNIIENNNTLLLQLIGDILDISKIESGSLEFVYSDVDIDGLCSEVYQTAGLRLNNDSVTLSYDEHVPELVVISERNRLMQVLNNLLTNAMKFTQKGTIKMGYRLQEDGMILFYVSDTGCGIPKDKVGTIFDRFVKLNSFAQGTGLGLSICATIIEKLGGKIGVDSELSKGSTFWFTIPNTPCEKKEEQETEEEHKTDEEITRPEGTTILIAEDNESNYKLFESILKKEYRLIHAWNGLEAIELFKKHNPDLVIMDIKMPIMDGYTATEQIRKLSKTAVIIAATAYAFAEDEQRIQERGFNAYISKPVNVTLLKSKIAKLLSKV